MPKFKAFNQTVFIPNDALVDDNQEAKEPVTLPKFSVDHKNAEMIYGYGAMALANDTNALNALADMVDNMDDDYKKEVTSGFFMGLARIIRLINDDLTSNAYGNIVPLDSANVQAMLDLQEKEARA